MNEFEYYESRSTLEEQWKELAASGGSPALFFQLKECKAVAVYGIGLLAECLFQELQAAEIDVQYFILPEGNGYFKEKPICKLGNHLPRVDFIVVAETECYMQIEKRLCESSEIEVISIQELIDQTLRNGKRR